MKCFRTLRIIQRSSSRTPSQKALPLYRFTGLSGRGRGEQTGLYKHSFIWCSPVKLTEIVWQTMFCPRSPGFCVKTSVGAINSRVSKGPVPSFRNIRDIL